MGKRIVVTKSATRDLKNIVQYLLSEFGEDASEKFLSRFDEVCGIISHNPLIYPLAGQALNTRRGVVKRQCIIYYRVRSKSIEVVRLFDTRQNPDRLKGLI